MIQFVVYVGEDVKAVKSSEEEALKSYNSLPSGEGKRPGLRRSLVKETILKEDKR